MNNNNFVEPQRVKQLTADFTPEDNAEIMEFSVFNQAAIIFNRQDKLLNTVHNLIYEARNYDPKLICLRDFYHAIRNAMMPTRSALHIDDQKKFERLLDKFSEKLAEFDRLQHTREATKEEIKAYHELHMMAYDLGELLYAAQQKTGMGILKERSFSSAGRIRNAVRS